MVNPLALVVDPDNHVLVCLAEDSPFAQWVVVDAGLFHDPGDIANPATFIDG